jgi:hypothetical protein
MRRDIYSEVSARIVTELKRGAPPRVKPWSATPGQNAPQNGSQRWARIQRHQLLAHPLCKYCLERGIVTAAEICDHVEPHRGNVNKFWLGPPVALQALSRRREALCRDAWVLPGCRTRWLAAGPAPSCSR